MESKSEANINQPLLLSCICAMIVTGVKECQYQSLQKDGFNIILFSFILLEDIHTESSIICGRIALYVGRVPFKVTK